MITESQINSIIIELTSLGLVFQHNDTIGLTEKGKDQIKIFKASNPEMYFLLMLGFHLIQETKK